jgi:hypothetical protein
VPWFVHRFVFEAVCGRFRFVLKCFGGSRGVCPFQLRAAFFGGDHILEAVLGGLVRRLREFQVCTTLLLVCGGWREASIWRRPPRFLLGEYRGGGSNRAG